MIGVESEIDSLNYKLELLSKDLADRKVVDEAGNDQYLIIKEMTNERNKYKKDLFDAHRNLEDSNEKINELKNSLNASRLEMSVSKENLAMAKASLKKEGGDYDAKNTISQLQQIWGELGADSSLRENAQKRIEFCLEDTCATLLDNANVMKSSTEKEVGTLSHRLHMMKKALGLPTEESSDSLGKRTLIQTLTTLREQVRTLEVPYRFAAARRCKLVEGVRNLSGILGLPAAELHKDLTLLLQHDENKALTTSKAFGEQKNNAENKNPLDNALPAKSLETEFLSRCEGHVSELRIAKSEMLLKSRERQANIAVLMTEMHLNESQSLSLIGDWIKRNKSSRPKWWNSKLGESILSDLARAKFLPLSSANHSQHLELMNTAMSSSAESRRTISETLKSVIEHAQKTLLNIVGREIDASEAYAGFHDALFRMPPLSKDLVVSCLSELESLIDGIEAMAQTETEALTVVWEALKVSQEERRDFWAKLEKSKSNSGLENENEFSEKSIGAISSSEGWMTNSVTKATNLNRTLKRRLRKLEGINIEVERLRSKQDTKSQILSLDSEIRIMNAKLLDFEELKCNKERLLTKKTGGATLLKEERFRKQMQNKFLVKLKQLVNLLRTWESNGNGPFDDSLLSDDVRELLKEDTDQMENWVDMRTKLMRLRTIKAPVLKNRTNEVFSLRSRQMDRHNSRHATGLTPPKKRRAPATSATSKPSSGKRRAPPIATTGKPSSGTLVHSLNKKSVVDQNNTDLRTHKGVAIGEQSPKRRKRQPKSVSMPFGSILADSPQRKY